MENGPVLVIAAVEREIVPLREILTEPLLGRVRPLVSGIGKINSAVATARAVRELHPSRVVQIGCAGGYPSVDVAPGDVACATEDVLADEGVEGPDGFLGLEDIGLETASRGKLRLYNRIPTEVISEGNLEILRERFRSEFPIHVGRFVTVSSGSGSESRATEIERRWGPLAESMEGAAAALICWKERVPFVEIRGISNLVGNRERASWDVDTACRRSARVAHAYIANLLGSRQRRST